MKIIVLAAVIIGAMALPAQGGQLFVVCADWHFTLRSQDGLTAKHFYLTGFGDGVDITHVVNGSTVERHRQVLATTWPQGVTIPEMIPLLDKYCAESEHFGDAVAVAIMEIAKQRR